MVVASSEAVLYLIWDSRRSKNSPIARLHINSSTHRPRNVHLTREPGVGNGLTESSTDHSPDGCMDDASASLNMEIHRETRGLRERVPNSSGTHNENNTTKTQDENPGRKNV